MRNLHFKEEMGVKSSKEAQQPIDEQQGAEKQESATQPEKEKFEGIQ